MVQVHLIIKGVVQGVFFRTSSRDIARKLKIKGYVRNLPDGSVEAVAEGEKKSLEKFVEWCHKGPKGAKVEGVAAEYGTAGKRFEGFNIRYG